MNEFAIKPCWSMHGLIHGLVDGKLSGFLLRYTRWHIRICRQCRIAYEALLNLIGRLHNLKSQPEMLTEEQWATVHAAWDKKEQTRGP